jgi:uncharacterized protein DUF6547
MIPKTTAAEDSPAARSLGNPLEEYKAFIDGLVHPSRFAQWARQGRWPDYETNLPAEQVNELLSELTPERRELLARMLERAEDVGTLGVLYRLDSYRLSRQGVELPSPFPYGLTSLWGSWSSRKKGDGWPQGPGEEFESLKNDD